MATEIDVYAAETPVTAPAKTPPLVFRATGGLLPFVLVLPFLVFALLKCVFRVPANAAPDWQSAPWAGTALSYVAFEWMAIGSSILFFGALGATVSAFTRASAAARARPVNLLAVQALGSVFAAMLALMFVGGLVQGSIFPQFANTSWSALQFDSASWARLLVWSFLAGFSERLVPDLLDRLIHQSREDGKAKR